MAVGYELCMHCGIELSWKERPYALCFCCSRELQDKANEKADRAGYDYDREQIKHENSGG